MTHAGENALAVRVSSSAASRHCRMSNRIKARPGENGGMEVIDGPTFAAGRGLGLDPRDSRPRTGIWQDVTLTATGAVEIGDLNVVTTLPKPDRSEADVEIEAPLTNTSRKRRSKAN